MNKEIILKLLEIKQILLDRIRGNYANQISEKEINDPYIQKIDEMIYFFGKGKKE